MAKYDINWLKEKGFFEKTIPLENEDKKVDVDGDNLLAYTEVFNNEEVERIRKWLSSSAPKAKYIYFYFPPEEKVKVFRRYGGELPWFWYKPELRKEFLKSREDKLHKFSVKNMDILFDTRDIAERFYWQLWEVRIKLAKSVKDLEEDGNKLLVIQHLLDRLIFFYFLAQLGLVRIKNKEIDWKLDRKRTRAFFKWVCDALSEKDLQVFLNKIFFDVLRKMKKSGWSSEYFKIGGEKFFVIAPSLNGGLFVEEEFEGKREREIRIKGIRAFILEILNNYNWVIGEEVPEEEDVIGELTPEIIGHIYEKFVVSLEEVGKQLKRINLNDIKTVKGELRAGRKKIGAYYTPTEITNYISMNTIYPYITDRINNEFKTNYKNIWNELLNGEKLTRKKVEIIRFLYFKALKDLRICDNACGSGSFLIAAGDILLRLYSRVLKILKNNLSGDIEVEKILKEMEKSPTRNYYIVRQIIADNLYGVDIMEGAIEIAKLRLWLWLISQIDPRQIRNKRIETLPNLDFNLMAGNSLIGFVEEKIVADLKTRYLSLESFEYQDIIKEKEELVDKFKVASGEKRRKLKEKIDEIDKPNREFLNKKFYELLKNKNISIDWEEFLKLKPFHWSYEFPKVFGTKNPEERGFDVVIGNPPYVFTRGEKVQEMDKEIFKSLFPLIKDSTITGKAKQVGKLNLLSLFILSSFNVLKNCGYFSYILQNTLLRATHLDTTRKFILENFEIKEILDAGKNVFVGVTASVVILILEKVKEILDTKVKVLYGIESVENKKFNTKFVSQKTFLDNPAYVFSIYVDKNLKTIFDEIEKNSKLLKKHVEEIIEGIVTPKGKQKFLSSEKKNEVYKKFLEGKNIGRYKLNWKGRYILYDINKLHRPRSKEIFESKEKIILQRIGGGEYSINATYDDKQFYTFASINNIILKPRIGLGPKFILVMLNSKLLNFYYKFNFTNLSELTVNISKTFLEYLPIKLPKNQQPFVTLCDYMLSLNKTEERRDSEKDLINFIDKQIIDSLVYELYFKEELKTNLLQLVEPYLKDVENLKPDEEKLITIKHVVKKIKTDRKIMGQIAKIKSHPWVKVIEEKA